MPVSGLIALLDDIATLADNAAAMAAITAKKGGAMTDNVANLTVAATKKTSGVVTDDMAVTAEQAVGLRPEREIPVVLAIAKGSMQNKGLILVPGALLLNAVAPWGITPLLMAGGLFLCFEGAEKLLHRFFPHPEEAGADQDAPQTPEEFEKMRIASSIRTDLVLSAEIIAISLGEVKNETFVMQAVTLYVISIVMTVGVYGVVALLIKLDDMGLHLVQKGGPREGLGRAILAFTPKLMHAISNIGTFAMLLVGGQILMHGFHAVGEAVEHVVAMAPFGHGLLMAAAEIVGGAIAGLLTVGAVKLGSKLMPKRKKKEESKAALAAAAPAAPAAPATPEE